MPEENMARNIKLTQLKITDVIKRDGSQVEFDLSRVQKAIYSAMQISEEGSDSAAAQVAEGVYQDLLEIKNRYKDFIPNVEGIQDAVEKELILGGFVATAKRYILYREEHKKLRLNRRGIPEHVRKLAEESKGYFKSWLAEFVYIRTYARWIDAENRRETWVETVDRYMGFMRRHLKDKLTDNEYSRLRMGILKQEAMPSMRLLQFAGPAAETTNVCAYNCSFIAPSNLQDFAEVMYVSMCGTGVGFAVESQNIQMLPQIQPQTGEMLDAHLVGDSKEGWCDALKLGLEAWFAGKDITFDFSAVRPAGARLKTIGGKSSGPEPLRNLLNFARTLILSRQGKRLSNLNAHDILCKIGEIVVAGGVRRSAMISLSDLDDVAMRDAKKGQFYMTEPQRSISNNSAVYDEKPSNEVLLEEWIALIKSGSGERGIFNRGGLAQTLPDRRLKNWTKDGTLQNGRITGFVGTNPCGEIILKSKQFCNLSEVVARAEDTEETLMEKMELAAMLGTFQSTLTDFPYLSEGWEQNCKEERLLGVSITGQWDCEAVRDAQVLTKLKTKSLEVNAQYAERFGVGESTCVTCVKPSGTVSQTVDCSSGMHPRYSPYYIRRIRISSTDALFKMLRDQGIPCQPEVGQNEANATTYVIDFPAKSPDGAVCKDDLTALDQLEHWKTVKQHYTEHNPSVTISVGEDEWIDVVNWLSHNWEIIGGLSFLPRSNHVYQLAPYEEITKEQYEQLLTRFDKIDFSQLLGYEQHDETEVKREMACVGGSCELN